MSYSDTSDPTTLSRRGVLSALGIGVLTTNGCIQQTRNMVNRSPPGQLSITIKTTPAETDTAATLIARNLETGLTAVGMNVQVVPMAEDELYRDVLINHDFELYIARHAGGYDPDFLRPLLHSQFSEEPGWQNPFGVTELAIDTLLNDQLKTTGAERREILNELQYEIAQTQPFTVIAIPNKIRGVRTNRFTGWGNHHLTTPLGYLSLQVSDGALPRASPETQTRLTVTVTDERITRNFNPIAVEFRSHGPFIDLVYDSLVRWDGTRYLPWLAEQWSWDRRQDESRLTVELRDGLTWHDGESITSDDVVFTYQFLADTSLDEQGTVIPAPRFRGRVSLISGVTELEDNVVRFTFHPSSESVAVRSLTVPILPRHVWYSKSSPADIAGFELFEGTTEALVWANPEPVGSGPFRVRQLIPDDSLVLERNDDHFLTRTPADDTQPYSGGPVYDELIVRVAPSDEAAVELVRTEQADLTGESVKPSVVPDIGRSNDVSLEVTTEREFYHIGYNAREPPTSNANFRRAVARLIDKTQIVDEVFGGFAEPIASPLAGSEWIAPTVQWVGEDPVLPFIGEDGDVDTDAAVTVFKEAGYQYNESGELLARTS